MGKTRVFPGSNSRLEVMILACFFLSGLTGLLYEILWTRMIVKIIGGAPFAVSIILTVFMGGLGLGAYLAGKRIDRIKEPGKLVKIYGILELTIGAYALTVPLLVKVLLPVYSLLYNKLYSHFILYNLLTFFGVSIILCIPVICMGATLPVLCRFYVSKLSHLGTHVGLLYGLNTIGAAFGALLGGFWLIDILGVTYTLLFAVVINCLIGFYCVFISAGMSTSATTSKGKVPVMEKTLTAGSAVKTELSLSPGIISGALAIFAFSGFCAMAYEVIWTKLLGLIVGPTMYSFTIVLVAFILGLASGSLIFGRLADKVKEPIWLLISTQIAAALFALLVSQFLGNSQLFFAKLILNFKDQFALLNLLKAVILFCVMMFPTLCLGATFPLVGKIYTQSVSTVGKSLGIAYMVNTIGAVLGSFSAGFILIPLIGKEKGLSLVIGLQLLSSLTVAMIILAKKKEGMLKKPFLTIAALVGLLLCFNFPLWNRHSLSIGKYHRFDEVATTLQSLGWWESSLRGYDLLKNSVAQSELVYYGDGIGGFTTVLKSTDPFGNIDYVLNNSGKAEANSKSDMATQTLLAHFGMLVHPNPKTVMVLGLASGITAGEVLNYPVNRLDVLEISQEVVAASDFFRPWNSNVLANPKTHLIIQDGRAHLQLTKQKYDVIISEPSNPWMAGMATLFTGDFLTLSKDRLNDEGIFVQWIHSYQMDWPTFALAGRTFASVFPNSLLLTSGLRTDFLLVGFKNDNALWSLENAAQKLQYVRKSGNVTLDNAAMLSRFIVSENLPALFGQGEIHSDNRPRLEYTAPKVMYYADPITFENIQSKAWVKQETKIKLQQLNNNLDDIINSAAYDISVNLPFKQINLSGATPSQRERFSRLVEKYCSKNVVEYSIFTNAEIQKQCLTAQVETLNRNIDLLPDKARSYFILAQLYRNMGDLNKAAAQYSKSLQINPDNASAHENLAIIYYNTGMIEKSITEYDDAIRSGPNLIEPRRSLSWILATNQDPKIRDGNKAVDLAEQANKQTNFADPHLLDTLAVAYASAGRFTDATAAAERALKILSQSSGNEDQVIQQIRNRLQLYKVSKIYTEPLPKKLAP